MTARKPTAYYNEFDPYSAQWLRNLIAEGLIAPGDVDDRSIKEVQPKDLDGYTQCHFFAGIGGWSLALRMAEWSDDEHVWTGSCPCQPYSAAGKGLRQSDERHLWPDWRRLIRESRPATIFGEQVDDAIAAGWLDDVFHDLETETYACAAAVLPARGIGAEHERQRLWWVADTGSAGLPRFKQQRKSIRSSTASASSKRHHRFLPTGIQFVSGPDSLQSIDGLSRPVGIVRGFGNAIVPQVAAQFIAAFMETTNDRP